MVNVAWGDMTHFMTYAAKLNPWFAKVVIPALAWFVTAAETGKSALIAKRKAPADAENTESIQRGFNAGAHCHSNCKGQKQPATYLGSQTSVEPQK